VSHNPLAGAIATEPMNQDRLERDAVRHVQLVPRAKLPWSRSLLASTHHCYIRSFDGFGSQRPAPGNLAWTAWAR